VATERDGEASSGHEGIGHIENYLDSSLISQVDVIE
jgi:hypothetical protein